MTKLEEICRAICVADNVDPDAIGMGLGQQMPEGEKYPLWRARIKQAQAVLDCLSSINKPMREAAGYWWYATLHNSKSQNENGEIIFLAALLATTAEPTGDPT